MFNWKPSVPVQDEWKGLMEERISRFENALSDLKESINRDRLDQWKMIKDATEAAQKAQNPPDISKLIQRLDTLELWRGQLHTLLTERGNTGKEKLSRMGNSVSKFYGKS